LRNKEKLEHDEKMYEIEAMKREREELHEKISKEKENKFKSFTKYQKETKR
jgi:hypothetical protein